MMLLAAWLTMIASATEGWASIHVGPITDMAMGRDGLLSCSQAGILHCQTTEPEASPDQGAVLLRPNWRVLCLETHRDAIYYGGGHPGRSGWIGSLNGKEESARRVADDLVYDMAYHAGSSSLVAACADGAVRLYSLPSFELTRTLHRHEDAAVTVAHFREVVVSGGLDGAMLITPLDSEGMTKSLIDHTAAVTVLRIRECPDAGPTIWSGARDGKVRVHTLAGRLLRTYRLGLSPITAMTTDGASTVVGCQDGTLSLLAPQDVRLTKMPFVAESPITALSVRRSRLWVGHRALKRLPFKDSFRSSQ